MPDVLPDLTIADAPHGYDPFGLCADAVRKAYRATRPIYDHWFRVRSYGAERLNHLGAAILAANHSGTLPIDGVMIWHDVLRHTHPPRVPRPIADVFVPNLPFVSLAYARTGVVAGSRGNVHHLLHHGELLLIFPEGTGGIGKPIAKRYQLQRWNVGHAELAIRHQVPIVPVAVIGAEEQMPQLARLPIRAFGSPYLPVPATLVPLPVRYHIHYGAPLDLRDHYAPDRADDPASTEAAAAEVKDAVAALIRRGLALRDGVFA